MKNTLIGLAVITALLSGCGSVVGSIHVFDESIIDKKYDGLWINNGLTKAGTETAEKEAARYKIQSINGGYLVENISKTGKDAPEMLFCQLIRIKNNYYLQIPWQHGANIIMSANIINDSEMYIGFIDNKKLEKANNDKAINSISGEEIRKMIVNGIDIFDDVKFHLTKATQSP
jgi:uncharacterized protein YceK